MCRIITKILYILRSNVQLLQLRNNIRAVIGRRTNWHRVRMQRLLPVHTEPARPLPISHDAAGIVEDLVGHRAADNERRGLHERVPRSFEKVHSKASVVDRILQ